MCIYSLRHSGPGMAKDTFFGRFVCAGVIQQRGHGMSAVMGRMLMDIAGCHNAVPQAAEPGIRIGTAISIGNQCLTGGLHPRQDERKYFIVYWYRPYAGGGFTFCDPEHPRPEVDVLFGQRQ